MAGQLDTPMSGSEDSGMLCESFFSETNYRKTLGSRRSRDESEAMGISAPTSIFQLPTDPVHHHSNWSTVAVTIGDVVGRMWQFCKAGAVSGFYAGGGQGFRMTAPRGSSSSSSSRPPVEAGHADGDGDELSLQGEDRYSYNGGTPSPGKRAAAEDLSRNWVVVNGLGRGEHATTASPTRRPVGRNQGPSPATGRRIIARPSKSTGAAGVGVLSPPTSPVLTPPPFLSSARQYPATSASFASPRSSASMSYALSSPPPRQHQQRRHSVKSPLHHSFRHSHEQDGGASTASSRGGGGVPAEDAGTCCGDSPRLSDEARRLAAQRHRADRAAEVRMAAFNKQLQDMIRQGKEALGTKIEVEDAGDVPWEDD